MPNIKKRNRNLGNTSCYPLAGRNCWLSGVCRRNKEAEKTVGVSERKNLGQDAQFKVPRFHDFLFPQRRGPFRFHHSRKSCLSFSLWVLQTLKSSTPSSSLKIPPSRCHSSSALSMSAGHPRREEVAPEERVVPQLPPAFFSYESQTAWVRNSTITVAK